MHGWDRVGETSLSCTVGLEGKCVLAHSRQLALRAGQESAYDPLVTLRRRFLLGRQGCVFQERDELLRQVGLA